MPALVEADDDGLYVVKLLGAGHGRKALVAELLAGELARHLGLPGPRPRARGAGRRAREGGAGRRDPGPARALRRDERRPRLPARGARRSRRPIGPAPEPELAAAVVWLDAFTTNVDRTPRNPNLIVWHRRLHLIDHGSALYIHHSWKDPDAHARRPFVQVRDHVLLPVRRRRSSRRTRGSRRWSTGRCSSALTGGDPRRLAAAGGRASRTRTRTARAYVDYLGDPPAGPRRVRRGGRACPSRLTPPGRSPFEYAIVRVVPRVERGEALQRRHRPDVPAAAVPRRARGARRGAARGDGARLRPGDRRAPTSRPSSAIAAGRRRTPGRSRRSPPRSGSTGSSRRRRRSSSRRRSTRA